MGNIIGCRRRRVVHNNKFKKAVHKVIKLLTLRRIWSRSGSYLNTAHARLPENSNTRRIMAFIFTSWPRTVLRNTKSLFDHLKREKGQLTYK